MNLRLDIAYHGAPFRGFARQPDVRTVQGELEDALGKLTGAEMQSVGAGRTDAGVHALGQVVSVALPAPVDVTDIQARLNAMLAPHIAVTRASAVEDEFNARFAARSRLYVYAILQGDVPDPFLATTTLHHPGPLDLDAMNEAAGHLVGPKDFASFGRVPDGGTSERILYELRCRRDGRVVRVRARANAFLQQMVRSLVGTLIEVGEGRRAPDSVLATLEARDRAAAGAVAPPHGLCLTAVEYDDGWSRPPDVWPVV